MASMAHRFAKGLVGGCALLLGVTVTGCGAPQYTYVANSSQSTYFKVPYGWHKIDPGALQKAMQAVLGSAGSGWQVAYQAGKAPTANDFLSFGADQPFVFAEIGTLTSTTSQELSYDALRDFFLPVSSTARGDEPAGFPLTDFKQIRDQVLTPGLGVHGVRETFDYPYEGSTDTFEEIALTTAEDTNVYFMVLHCMTTCYSTDQTEINDVMSSFTIRSP